MNKVAILITVMAFALGFYFGFLVNRERNINTPFGGTPTWEAVGDQTWDALR